MQPEIFGHVTAGIRTLTPPNSIDNRFNPYASKPIKFLLNLSQKRLSPILTISYILNRATNVMLYLISTVENTLSPEKSKPEYKTI